MVGKRLRFLVLDTAAASGRRTRDERARTSAICAGSGMGLSLLTRCLHQTECIKVRKSLLIVAMHMDLGIDRFANELLWANHHGSFHAWVRDVGHHV